MLINRNTKVPSTGKIIKTYGVPIYDTQKSYVSELYCTEEDNSVVVGDRSVGRIIRNFGARIFYRKVGSC